MDGTVIAAFPSSLSSSVNALASQFDLSTGRADPFSIFCDGDRLVIPSRIYGAVPSDAAFGALPLSERAIVACWFTRHHDGHVRETFLRSIPAYDSAWIISYVIALCGEYVVEILDFIWKNRSFFDQPVLEHWLGENQLFYELTRSRITSYWDCYYRGSFPHFIDSRIIE